MELLLQGLIPNFSWRGITINKNGNTTTGSIGSSGTQPMAVFGEGMMHRNGMFPGGAMVPVTWMITLQPWGHEIKVPGDSNAEDIVDDKQHDMVYLHLMVHPSVVGMVMEDLLSLLGGERPTTTTGKFLLLNRNVNGGLACLRLRGTKSEACIRLGMAACTRPLVETSSKMHELDSYLEETTGSPHLSVFCLESYGEEEDEGAHQQQLQNRLFIVRQAPRDPTMSQNVGVCGYDIYCCPAVANELLFAFVMKGGACPIGIAEDAHFCLEAEPPVPVFPRDFVDTAEGHAYWTLDGDSKWRSVRAFLESGTGRLVRRVAAQKSVDWHAFVLLDDNTNKESDPLDERSPVLVAVVRGALGDPFRNALLGTTGSLSHDCHNISTPECGKKRRRPHRASNSLAKAPCLSKVQMSQMKESCHAMSKTLALPALLLCHIQVSGGGKLVPGDTIQSMHSSSSAVMLGAVTSGCFSPSRGLYHGIGIVGAARFLHVLARTDRACPPFVVRQRNNTREVQLGVVVVGGDRGDCVGTISLLLE
jgi:hypothetical protein